MEETVCVCVCVCVCVQAREMKQDTWLTRWVPTYWNSLWSAGTSSLSSLAGAALATAGATLATESEAVPPRPFAALMSARGDLTLLDSSAVPDIIVRPLTRQLQHTHCLGGKVWDVNNLPGGSVTTIKHRVPDSVANQIFALWSSQGLPHPLTSRVAANGRYNILLKCRFVHIIV